MVLPRRKGKQQPRVDQLGLEVSHEQHQQQIDREYDDNLLIGPSSAVFLHTIPEGDSSDVAAASGSTPTLNPAALAALSPPAGGNNNNNNMNASGGGGVWPALLKPLTNIPQSPPSVASSTRAVEAGHEVRPETAPQVAGAAALASSANHNSTNNNNRDLSLVAALGGSSSVGPGMDESNTAALAGDDAGSSGKGGAHRTTGGGTGHGIKKKLKRRHSITDPANKKKVGVVCSLAVILVIGVIIGLVFIVKKLDETGDGSSSSSASSAAPSSVIEPVRNASNITIDGEPTVAPSQAESVMSTDPLFFFDDDHDLLSVPEGCGENANLFNLMDEAVSMLYTSDIPERNVITSMTMEIFSEQSSPRYKAREWLLNEDKVLQSVIEEFKDCPSSEPAVKLERIIQRYIMLVFYFATVDTQGSRALRGQRKLQEGYSQFSIDPNMHECFWIPNACGQEDSVDTYYDSPQDANNQVDDNAQIVYLNASHADLVGTVPFELGYLTELRELSIHGNKLEGSIPDLLPIQLQYLYLLDLSDNQFEGQIPESVWTLSSLRFAYLSSNRFNGTIPNELPSDPSVDLEAIWLWENQLSGEIPQWWTQLPSLKVLSVKDNEWTGTIPDDWTADTRLEFVDISINKLSGTIPASLLYSVPTLKHLYLDNNTLSGTLPLPPWREEEDNQDFTAIFLDRSNSLQLEALWLQNNKLSGTIPTAFGRDWNKLQQLELQGNELSGIWECAEEKSNIWPDLEELSVDCAGGPSLLDVSAATITEGSSNGGGVNMEFCDACGSRSSCRTKCF
mgnify:CR=1 FL=1